MLFCSECGGALNLFESNDEEICWHCIRRRDKPTVASPPKPAEEPAAKGIEALVGATFQVDGDKLVLLSPEGWVLWSGPLATPVSFETIVARAWQIYRIRQRRKNRKS